MRGLALAIAVVGGVLSAAGQTDSISDPFALTEGTYWVYQGLVRYDKTGSGDSAEATVNWRMEIVRVLGRDDAKAAIVKGFPTDLNWSTGSATPTESMLVRTNDGRFYLIDKDHTAGTEQKFRDTHVALQDFLEDDDLWFQLPLAQGKTFCDEESKKRNDGMYCWIVDAPTRVSLNNVKDLKAKSATAFRLSYRTLPDDEETELAPGVGIIRYGYHHHGTVADTELKLVEFHVGP